MPNSTVCSGYPDRWSYYRDAIKKQISRDSYPVPRHGTKHTNAISGENRNLRAVVNEAVVD